MGADVASSRRLWPYATLLRWLISVSRMLILKFLVFFLIQCHIYFFNDFLIYRNTRLQLHKLSMKMEIPLWQLCFMWTKTKRNWQITYLHKSTNCRLLAPSEMLFLVTSNSCLGTTYLMSSSEFGRNPDKNYHWHLHKFTFVHFSINSRVRF